MSMPLRWDEVGRFYPAEFTLRSAGSRLREVGDLWRDIVDYKADLSRVFAAVAP